VKSPIRSPAIRRAVEAARRLGYTVEFQDPIMVPKPMAILPAGICDLARKRILVGIRGMSREQIAAIIEHELEHALGAEHATDRPDLGLRCGGMV
jgi:hypothetical protein